jgi:hypothetical protein
MSRSITWCLFAALVLARDASAATAPAAAPVDTTSKTTVIINTPDQPVPVIVNGGTPVVVELLNSGIYTVPAGKRLIIEFFSIAVTSYNTPDQVSFGLGKLNVFNGNQVTPFALKLQHDAFGNPVVFQDSGGSTAARIYVDAGLSVAFGVDTFATVPQSSQDISLQGTFSGTLVNSP